MADPYLGEIRCFGFNFAPYQWALCNGQLLPINQNVALFSILGTTYGGNGVSTFALPNLQGQIPMHWGSAPGVPDTVIGEAQGTPTVSLNQGNIPSHNHSVTAVAIVSGGESERVGTPTAASFLGPSSIPDAVYLKAPTTLDAQFAFNAISPSSGGTAPHENRQPYLVLNFCIALVGVFPTRG
jgi:microcystin-dependent protein